MRHTSRPRTELRRKFNTLPALAKDERLLAGSHVARHGAWPAFLPPQTKAWPELPGFSRRTFSQAPALAALSPRTFRAELFSCKGVARGVPALRPRLTPGRKQRPYIH